MVERSRENGVCVPFGFEKSRDVVNEIRKGFGPNIINLDLVELDSRFRVQ